MTNSSKQWPQSIEAIETKCMEPLHFQDHKNESSIIVRCIQITKDHNNAKKLSSFLCPFLIDSWWKTSMVILSQVETKNNKEKPWWKKKFMIKQKMPTLFPLLHQIF